MKVTDKQIAEEFGITVQTLNNYKNGSTEKKKLYNALKNALIENNMIIWKVYLADDKIDYINNCIIGWYSIKNKLAIRKLEIFK